MPMKSYNILGYIKPTICFKANIGGLEAHSWRFNNLFFNAWCMVKFMHRLIQPPFIYNLCQSWGLDFVGQFDVIICHNQFVLIMIEHFSNWIELVPLWKK
jgi:hypothetical protein